MNERVIPSLPSGGEWATAPLLDKANVGRYVMSTFDNRRSSSVEKVTKVTRELVHTDAHHRARVFGPHIAHGEFALRLVSLERWLEEPERDRLLMFIRRHFAWDRLETEQLRLIVSLIEDGAS